MKVPLTDVDIVLFSAGSGVSRKFSPIAAACGAVVVDNSKAFRMDRNVPLVVPEVNADDVFKHEGVIANPNCSTIQLVVALAPIHRVNPIKRVIVDTYQSVSGAGGAGVQELEDQTRASVSGEEVGARKMPHPIAFNVIPEIDTYLDNGYFNEEWKIVQETRKIMHAPEHGHLGHGGPGACLREPQRSRPHGTDRAHGCTRGQGNSVSGAGRPGN